MNGALTIVPAYAADMEPIMAVMGEAFDPAFGEAWNVSQCRGILGLPGVWMLLARTGDGPAGFALARITLDEAELLLLGVRPRCRRAGVASALLDKVRGEALERGAVRLHLEVREGNPALLLYRAKGFADVGRRPNYYRGHDGSVFDAISLSVAID